jgi:hypothetical protein
VNANTHTQTKVDYEGPLDNCSDIERVTHFSEGKTLNAIGTTLWLGGGIRQNPSGYGASTVVYGMLIDSDNNPATGSSMELIIREKYNGLITQKRGIF